MNYKKYLPYLLFGLIFLLALFLRFYQLGDVPSGFHQDEVANTYVGRFILENGVDIYGNSWPLFYFNKHIDFPPVLPMYISSLGTYIFGVDVFGARFVIAFLSTLTLIPVYFISHLIFKNKFTAFVSMLFLAISPWHVAFSRIGTEGILATTFYMFGLMFLIYSIQRKHRQILVAASFFLLLTYFLYPAFRIITPLSLVASLIVLVPFGHNLFKKNKKFNLVFTVITILFFAFTLGIGQTEWGKGRFEQTSLLQPFIEGKNPQEMFTYNEDNVLISRIFNNKPIYLLREFSKQYLLYFSPNFLFIDGGLPSWFDVPNSGLFYLSFLIFLIPILFPFLRNQDKTTDRRLLFLLFLLLLIAPIPAALTSELTPHTHRSVLLSVLFIFFFAYGFSLLTNLPRKKIIFSILSLVLFLEFIYFFHNYFQHVSMYTAIVRGDGQKQVVEYIKKNKSEYPNIYMHATGWFPVYYLYFTKNFDKQFAGKFGHNFRIQQVDNVTFVDSDCLSQKSLQDIKESSGKSLVIVHSGCSLPEGNILQKKDEIFGSASSIAIYHIYEKK